MHFPRLLTTGSGDSPGQYELLPTSNSLGISSKAARVSFARRRCLPICLFSLPILILLATAWTHYSRQRSGGYGSPYPDSNAPLPPDLPQAHPPNFKKFYEFERAYPQHNRSLTFPEGDHGRFLYVREQTWSVGWNNVFQALIILSQMAYLSNRAFVFEPYTWHKGPEQYVDYNGHLIPSRIPLAALIRGPMAGGSFPQGSPAPRAVSKEWYSEVCPPERMTLINLSDVDINLDSAVTKDILDKYASVLRGLEQSCVEIEKPPIDWRHYGTKHLTTVWPELSLSPIVLNFTWSPLVLTALQANALGISPEFEREILPIMVDDLAAVHVRRGDYEAHCHHLANWSSSYMGWNQLPGLPDTFEIPPGGGWGENTPENRAIYMSHCWPTIDGIAKKIRESRRDWEAQPGRKPLRRLYVLTNGKRNWVKELKRKLFEDGDWVEIFTSRDMELTFEQKYIAQAIDMAIAQKAALFIGNGFSSMSANIVLLRSVNKLPMNGNRFWS